MLRLKKLHVHYYVNTILVIFKLTHLNCPRYVNSYFNDYVL